MDVILLNKYLAGLVVLSDQQKLNADCYSDGVIDDFDSMALIKFVILLIDNLPEYPEAIEAKKRNNGIDEFYKENIENSVGNFDLVKIAKTVKNKLSAQEDAKYTNGNLKLEDLYKEGKFVNPLFYKGDNKILRTLALVKSQLRHYGNYRKYLKK